MATSKKQTDQYNDKKSYVVKDLIWKDHVSKIETAQRFHNQKWGFLNDLQPQTSAYDTKRPSGTLLPSTRSSLTIDCKHDEDQLQQQHPTAIPSPRPIPSTTNRLIGWRTADKNCTLEKYGKYARGQESLHKKFKWPVEGFD